MYHPLYPVAQRMMGRPVNVHHVNGRTYSGVLGHVAPHGIYLAPRGSLMSGTPHTDAITADEAASSSDIDLVYSPYAYFGFGALTGLTIGALAGGWWW